MKSREELIPEIFAAMITGKLAYGYSVHKDDMKGVVREAIHAADVLLEEMEADKKK